MSNVMSQKPQHTRRAQKGSGNRSSLATFSCFGSCASPNLQCLEQAMKYRAQEQLEGGSEFLPKPWQSPNTLNLTQLSLGTNKPVAVALQVSS